MIKFDNRFLHELPTDESQSRESRQLKGVCSARVQPTVVSDPEILIWSKDAAALLDLKVPQTSKGIEARVFSGNELFQGMEPYASRYGGHQFGRWAGQLGDGRAISLGEGLNSKGERFEIQLKGAGPTPFSRGSDGRAVLRSSLREFLCSEAMFFLGVPTTRALCCVTTGDLVMRDMFYDGHPKEEPGAITTRLAPTFIRFGNFEILAANGEEALLRKLVDFTIELHFPGFSSKTDADLSKWFVEVCTRTATLMVHWMRVGFVHGVMNTDNLSILGLTLDYGPYGWIDDYNLAWTPNTTDEEKKRYRFGNQANIALWNLTRLAQALSLVFNDANLLAEGLNHFQLTFESEYHTMMLQKLGLSQPISGETTTLLDELNQVLNSAETDMTLFFRKLADLHLLSVSELNREETLFEIMKDSYYESPLPETKVQLLKWIKQYLSLVETQGVDSNLLRSRMNTVNPYFVLRNYLSQLAIEALEEKGDRTVLDSLWRALQTPYEENENTKPFFAKRPEWARNKPGSSALSCSS